MALAHRGKWARQAADAIDRPTAVLLAAGCVVRLWLMLALGYLSGDDLITARYANNLAHGRGWVYNAGEHVLGTTSPLWTIVNVPLAFADNFSILRLGSTTLGLVCWAVSTVIVLDLAKRWHPAIRLLTLAALTLHPLLVTISVSGMEESLFVLVVLLSMLCATRGRLQLAFVVGGVAVLTRPEGVVWVATLLLAALFTRAPRRRLAHLLAGAAVPVLPWVVFGWVYFGSPIPQSARAKTGVNGSVLKALWHPSDAVTIGRNFTGAALAGVPSILGDIVALFVLAALLVAAFSHRDSPSNERTPCASQLAAWFVLGYCAFYYFGRGDLFAWYSYPAVFFTAFVMGAQANRLAGRVRPQLDSTRWLVVTPGIALMTVLLLAAVPLARRTQDYEDLVRRPTGEWISRCTPSGTSVMLETIGYTGFFSRRYVVDVAGLVTPRFAELARHGPPGWPGETIAKEHPNVIVLRAFEVESNSWIEKRGIPIFGSAAARRTFDDRYRAAATFGTGDYAMRIYVDRSLSLTCPD